MFLFFHFLTSQAYSYAEEVFWAPIISSLKRVSQRQKNRALITFFKLMHSGIFKIFLIKMTIWIQRATQYYVPTDGWQLPHSLISPFLFTCSYYEFLYSFLINKWKHMTKLFKLNSWLIFAVYSILLEDILMVFLPLAEFVVETCFCFKKETWQSRHFKLIT